jgi:ligand-binding sensor domain-containing protein
MKLFLVYLLLLFSFRAAGQEYNYIHYDTKDGLASSTVYSICQDKKGYIWFATNNGLSRFDGKKFTNYTTEDGLTDNEVLGISPDSKGRVWVMPFNKTLCYYYEDKIYVVKIDSSFKQTNLSSYFGRIGEGRDGEYYFHTSDGIFVYKNSGTIRLIADFKKLAAKYSVKLTEFFPMNMPSLRPDPVALYIGHSIFRIINDSLVYLKKVKYDLIR